MSKSRTCLVTLVSLSATLLVTACEDRAGSSSQAVHDPAPSEVQPTGATAAPPLPAVDTPDAAPPAPDPSGCAATLTPPLAVVAPVALRADGPWQRCGAYGAGAARVLRASADGSRAALVTDSGEAWVLDLPGLTLRNVFTSGTGRLAFAALSPDGTKLAAVDELAGRVALWDVATGALLHVWQRQPESLSAYDLGDIAFSHDGTRVAVVSASHLDVYDVTSGLALPISARTDVGGGMHVEFVAGDARLVIGRFQYWGNGPYAGWGRVDLVDADTGDFPTGLDVNLYIELPQIVVSGDQTVIGVGNAVDGIVFFDAATGARRTTPAMTGTPVGLSADGARVAVLASDAPEVTIRRVADGGTEATVAVTHARSVAPLVAVSDLTRLLVGDGVPTVLTSVEVASGAIAGRACAAGHTGWSLALSADGEHLVTNDGTSFQSWNVATGAPEDTLPADTSGPSATSPDGTLFAQADASRQGYFVIRKVASGEVVRVIGPHPTRVTSLEWSPDGALIASGSERDPAERRANADVRVWSVASGALVQSVGSNSLPVALFHDDGRRLFLGAPGDAVVYCR